MGITNETLQMLEQFDKPAFIADHAKVLHANSKAQALQINEGSEPAFLNVLKETADNSNTVFSTCLHGINYTVSSSPLGENHLFIMDSESLVRQLQSIIRAAQQLRAPLSALTSSVNLLKDDRSDENLGKTSKKLLSLQRAVRNMSDASLFLSDRSGKKETVNLTAYLDEIVQKLQQHFQNSQISISYTGLTERSYCSVDIALLERAIYNMVSNSLKAGSTALEIGAKVIGKTLSLTISDNGCGMTNEQKSHILDMYRSDPDWIASGYGLGLGMMIVYAAAKAHNGTLLINDNEPHGCKITLTLTIEKGDSMVRQKPVNIIIDPLGGADALLLELSDVLPSNEFI